MENTPTLETERLLLRRFHEKDALPLFEILSDRTVTTFLPMFPLQNVAEAVLYLKKNYLESYQRPSGYRYAICLKTDDRPIGYVNISHTESHDLGYALRKEFWNQGITTEACQAVLECAKKAEIPFITATHDIKNPRSGAVMKKIGMTYCYSYEEQWQPKNILVTFRMYQINLDEQQDRIYWEYWNQYPVHFIETCFET